MKTEAERIEEFKQFVAFLGIEDDFENYLLANGFFTAPASTKYHGNYEGGLYDHSKAVMNALVDLTRHNNLKWENERSPYIVGMFHDLCKIDSYKVDNSEPYTVGEPTHWQYNNETLLKGHGDKSVMLLSSYMRLTPEEVMCIRYHMGAFTDKEEWDDYGRAIESFPNVLWTHHADMIATRIMGI